MAKNVVFLVHGIGRHADTWSSAPGGPIDTLQTVAQQYDKLAGKDVSSLIEFVPIRYDDIFDRILDQWQSLAQGLGKAGELLPGALDQAVHALEDVGNDDQAFLTFGGDLALYRGFRLFAQRVQMRVIRTIAETVAARLSEPHTTTPRFLVVAHSLGTTVAHDALHLLGTAQWLGADDPWSVDAQAASAERTAAGEAEAAAGATQGVANAFDPDHFHFEAIFMIANTSRLLHTIPEGPTASIVRPDVPANATHNCHRFFNVAHALDPVPAVMPFQMPAAWITPDETAADIRVRHVYAKNLHGLGHYLLNPQVHGRLLYYALEGWTPTAADKKKMGAFPPTVPQIAAKVTEIEAAWRALVDGKPDGAKLRDLVALVKDMLQTVENL